MDQMVLKGLMNPIRMKIFQYILMNKHATTAVLAKELPNVPQATLYRHINKMLKVDILGIYSENKVRGVYEKVYEIKNNPLEAIDKIIEEEDRSQLLNLYYSFTMAILMDFSSYLNHTSINLKEDRVGFRSLPMYLSDEESDAFMSDIHEVLNKHAGKSFNENRKLRQFSYTFIPTDEKE